MKQLLLENPRRRRRIRRNGGTLNYGMRTPVSPLYPNGYYSSASEFENLFKNKKRKSRKGRKRTKRKSSTKRRSRRSGAKRIRKNKPRRMTRRTTRTKRRTYMKIRKNRSRGGMAGIKGFASQFTKRENLSLAGGVLLAPIATSFVRKSITLPAIGTTPVTNAVYGLLIPGLGALLTRRFSPALANGMIIGGIAEVVKSFLPVTQTTPANRYLGEYLDPRRSMGAYIAPRQNAMGASVPNAFNAWAK